MWIDLDRDGVFESTTPGLGSNRGEQLSWNDGGTKTINLAEGDYRVAFTHREGGGGAQADFRFKSPTMASQVTIRPTHPSQAGMFTVTCVANNEVVKLGSGTVTLSGDNTYNGETTVQKGTLTVSVSTNQITATGPLGTTGVGTTVEYGGTLALAALAGDITLSQEALTINGGGTEGQPGALVNSSGNNTVAGPISLNGLWARVFDRRSRHDGN